MQLVLQDGTVMVRERGKTKGQRQREKRRDENLRIALSPSLLSLFLLPLSVSRPMLSPVNESTIDSSYYYRMDTLLELRRQ